MAAAAAEQTQEFNWAIAEAQFADVAPQTYIFDWQSAEAQFTGVTGYERPPQDEIYGRSLNTIYRLGAFMVANTLAEVVGSPEAEQARAEFYTSVEEGFGTDMKLGRRLEVRDFDTRPILDGKVMSKDLKTSVSDMTYAGLVCAVERARREWEYNDDSFLPQLVRSKWDHDNAVLVDKMARGETPYNTRIVISPFPEEGAAKSGDVYWRDIGYVPHLRRGFVQLYHATEDGIVAGSLSFDGSNKEQLREVFSRRGIDIPETEVTDNWLNYAITDTLTEEEAKSLALEIADEAADPSYKKTTNTVNVTHEHRTMMDRVFNESYVHACESLARGRQTPEARKLILQLANKAESFNPRYTSALYEMRDNSEKFSDDDMVILHELLVYSTIEMMRALHLKKTEQAEGVSGPHVDQVYDSAHVEFLRTQNQAEFQSALGDFAAEGAKNKRVYSACGLSISLGDEARVIESPQSAFGGYGFSEDKYGKLTFTCPNGHYNRRPFGKLLVACQHKGCKAKVTC